MSESTSTLETGGTGLPVPPSRARLRLAAVVAASLGALVFAAGAAGHALVQPGESRPAEFQRYTLTVPTERDVATTAIAMQVSEGISFLLVENAPGWEVEVVKKDDRIAEIRWTGGSIPPDFFQTFRFIARNPVEEGEITWPVVQTYADGEAVRWIGAHDSAEPAPRTLITEAATPTDVVNVQSGTGGGASAGASAEAAEEGDEGGSDTLTLVLAIVGVALGAAALLVALFGRRRPAAA